MLKQQRVQFYFIYSKIILHYHTFIVLLAIFLTLKPTVAQIIPDASLGSESSKVSTDLENSFIDKIDGGAIRGGNLFHSFEQFSISPGRTAYFNNALNIQNIISRVTGSSVSNIDGLIQANSNANLLLLNSNGIIFGSNASLNIGGSFLASTATSINFADGVNFSGSEAQSMPLLTVSVPVGLGFTSLPKSIRVEGNGHGLLANVGTAGNPVFGAGQSETGLRTSPEQSIVLVGGNVKIDGGILTAPSGQIEIGSVNSGLVKIEAVNDKRWTLNYDNVQTFQDIELDKLALLDASGLKNGNIFLRGRDITVTDRSLVIVSNVGSLNLGKVSINASGNLEIVGIRNPTNSAGQDIGPARGIVTQNLSSGKAANIEVLADNISIRDSGGITSASFASGASGDVFINSTGRIDLYGTELPTTGLLTGSISTSSSSTGKAGNLKLSAESLFVRDGSSVSSTTLRSADGGNVELNITNNIEVLGGALITFDPNFINNSFWPSFVGGITISSGKAGDVLVNTRQLSIEGGARIDSSTLASGSSGSLIINASDSISVDGKAANFSNPSLIISSANASDPFFKLFLNLPTVIEGESGSITLKTNQLNVLNGAQISARNDGISNGGSIEINANSINLDTVGSITASTNSGEGGNISLTARNLQLRNGSSIAATAGGTGNGGNITLKTGTLATLENSGISANAFQGNGGNIEIKTQGLFSSPESEISASSTLGINGTVNIQTLGFDVRNSIIPLQNNLTSSEQIVAGSCLARRNANQSSFVVTGSGSLPMNPYSEIEEWEIPSSEPKTMVFDDIQLNRNFHQSRSLAASPDTLADASPKKWKSGDPIIEAQGIIRLSDGRVLLGMKPQSPANAESIVCKH